jgi:ankyrin repeat protein
MDFFEYVDEDEKDRLYKTRLHRACQYGETDRVAFLLKTGWTRSVNERDEKSEQTPLHIACWNGHADCAALLLEAGADMNARGLGRCTPLAVACRRGSAECVRLLLESRAEIHTIDADFSTPLHDACSYGQPGRDNPDCVDLLLQYGAEAHARDRWGRTPLHRACKHAHCGVECARLLLECGADPSARDNVEGATPLRHAIFWGNLDCVRLLLKAGADVRDGHLSLVGVSPAERATAASHRAQAKVWDVLRRFEEGEGEKHWATEEVLRALLLAEARRAGCALSWDAAESVLRAVANV